MIAKRFRFHGHNALSYVYRKSRTARTAQLALKYVPNQRRRTYRAAVVVSKKLSKSAVVRNRIRRRLYEQVRGAVPPSASYDLVFTAFSVQLATMPEKELNEIVMNILQMSGLLPSTGKGETVDNSDRQPRRAESSKNYTNKHKI